MLLFIDQCIFFQGLNEASYAHSIGSTNWQQHHPDKLENKLDKIYITFIILKFLRNDKRTKNN